MLLFQISEALVRKFIKFALVGFTGVFVDFGFTYLFKEKAKVQKYLANAFGFMIAASTNYVLNRVWTFQSENPQVLVEYSEFILISIIGLGLNTLILWMIVSRLRWNFYFSKLFAIGFVTIWNFLANAFITFA